MLTTLRQKRRFIFLSILSLSLVGLLMIYSASCIFAWRASGDASYFFKRQTIFLFASILIFFVVLFADLPVIKEYNKEFLLGTIVLLVFVLFIGKKAGGARRWFDFGFFSFQPSELLKVFFPLYCADYFTRKGKALRYFRDGLLPLLLLSAAIASLIVLQPDLGTVVFWLMWMYIMLFVAGARKRHLGYIALSGVIAFAALVKTQPYRIARLLSYLDPWSDPKGAGFQIIQSQIAFGQGGIIGTGLGAGKQKLLFLPAAHTDFIFSIIAEEFGFIGSFLGVLFVLIMMMLSITRKIADPFARHLCLGITLVIGLETAINIGVSCGFFPTKGLCLPFMSYGGTSLLIHYMLLGLFFNVTKEHEHPFSL